MTTLLKDFVHTQEKSPEILPKIFRDTDFHEFWKVFLTRDEHYDFFNKTLTRTLQSLSKAKYSNFDAHTTANCCHGIATLVRSIILSTLHLDLKKVYSLPPLMANSKERIEEIPYQVLALMGLYVLTYVGKVDPVKARRTHPARIKEYSSVGTKFSEKLVRKLQKLFSNIVALNYPTLFEECNPEMSISSAPLSSWGKYIQEDFLRKDFKNIYYSPCLYSMQIVLGFLIASKAKIVLVNDLMTSDRKKCKGRYLRVLQGDGNEGFKQIPSEDLDLTEPMEKYEPVVVFGGCAFSDELHLDALSEEMDKWLFQFPNLVLACDCHYPQFPCILDDPLFDSSKVDLKDSSLKRIIEQSAKVPGVSSSDPSLFFLTHIYPASLWQILEEKQGVTTLPFSSIFTTEFTLSNQGIV